MIEQRPLRGSLQTSAAAAPVQRFALFGPAPLLEGEDSAAYDELLTQVSTAVKPADFLEEIWVHDIVNFFWEVLRGRRLKCELLKASEHKGLELVLAPLLGAFPGDAPCGPMGCAEAECSQEGGARPSTGGPLDGGG
jgi:hypothetical protein